MKTLLIVIISFAGYGEKEYTYEMDSMDTCIRSVEIAQIHTSEKPANVDFVAATFCVQRKVKDAN